jgi:hypothetical protein
VTPDRVAEARQGIHCRTCTCSPKLRLSKDQPVTPSPERYAKALEVVEALKNAGLDRTHSRYRGPNENPPVCKRCGLSWPCPKAALVTALAALDEVQASEPAKVEVKFVGGPWAGQTTTVERVVGPVFAVGHEVGNHYWLDSKSKGTPLYYWDGTS